ncbi:MAG: hypothetical protein ACOYM0_10900 [Bacteroidales bacterium]
MFKRLSYDNLGLKHNFHQLIESIENESLLQKFYELMLRKRASKDGSLWSKLPKQEIEELLLSNSECEDPANQVSHEDMKKKYAKWL